ncbi:hypothetical protein B0I35DRAFT_447067 [Stachybotrys elegans]|uniref:Peptidase S8/S53 domain-containing protein n=1 Tax=Stachybotrys elegans TaxID=80388 RepID=A0A8K0WJP3_9HYPO|nr:hypothetical protein B0I35DRAFT_447067 [Stachybotrys elegans]
MSHNQPSQSNLIPLERVIDALVTVAERIATLGHGRTSVLNMSWGAARAESPSYFQDTMKDILKRIRSMGTVLVVSAGNWGDIGLFADDYCPQRFIQDKDLQDMIIVGATNKQGVESFWVSQYRDQRSLLYAGGEAVARPNGAGTSGFDMDGQGTSYSAGLVSGLVAYLRGLNSAWQTQLQDPANVRRLLFHLARKLDAAGSDSQVKKLIWNGQMRSDSCLLAPQTPGCPKIPDDLSELPLDGGDGGSCGAIVRRQNGGSCPGNGGVPGLSGDPITWNPGEPSPTCISGCGTYCRGYYCNVNPSGMPPDFEEPGPSGTTTDPPLPPIPTGSACSSKTTTTMCNGSGGDATCMTTTVCALDPPLPTLPPQPSNPDCPTRISTVLCNGSGGEAACMTSTVCLPNQPTLPPYTPKPNAPSCPASTEICVKTSTYTRCARGVTQSTQQAKATAVAQATTTSSSVAVETTKSELSDAQIAPHGQSAESFGVVALDPVFNRLLPRQGCDMVEFCECGTVEHWPCLSMWIQIMSTMFGHTTTIMVEEDGEQVCKVTSWCWLAQGADNCAKSGEFDCGDKYKLSWEGSKVTYYSPKYEVSFPGYLEVTDPSHVTTCFFGGTKVVTICAESSLKWNNFRGTTCGDSKKRGLQMIGDSSALNATDAAGMASLQAERESWVTRIVR